MGIDTHHTCCFTGHRTDKLPWGEEETDPRCTELKQSITREITSLYQRGFRHFISGMAMGCGGTIPAEGISRLIVRRGCSLPHPGWPLADRSAPPLAGHSRSLRPGNCCTATL